MARSRRNPFHSPGEAPPPIRDIAHWKEDAKPVFNWLRRITHPDRLIDPTPEEVKEANQRFARLQDLVDRKQYQALNAMLRAAVEQYGIVQRRYEQPAVPETPKRRQPPPRAQYESQERSWKRAYHAIIGRRGTPEAPAVSNAAQDAFGGYWGFLTSDEHALVISHILEKLLPFALEGADDATLRTHAIRIANDFRHSPESAGLRAKARYETRVPQTRDSDGGKADFEFASGKTEPTKTPAADALMQEWKRRGWSVPYEIVKMHFGERAFANQPKRLLGATPKRELRKFHPGEICPTCRAIVKFYRVPGLTSEYTQEVIEAFLVEWHSSP